MHSGTQRVVGAIDSGLFLVLLRGAGVVLAVVLLVTLFARTQFTALRSSHAMEMADTARHMAAGEGARTGVIHPVDVALVKRENVGQSVPQLAYPPVWPTLLSWSMRATPPRAQGVLDRFFPADIRTILPTGLGFLLLGALVLFLFASRYAGGHVAGPAALIFMGGVPAATAVCEGEGLPVVMCLSILALWLVWEGVVAAPRWAQLLGMVLGGLFTGMAMLCWWSAWVVCVVVCVVLLVELRRLRWCSLLLYLLVCAAVVVPYLVHLHAVCGLPFGTAPIRLVAELVPAGSVVLRDALDSIPQVDVVMRTLRVALVQKMAEGVGQVGFLGGVGAFLLFLAAFRRYERQGGSGLRYGLLLGMLLAWAVGLLTGRMAWGMLLPLLLVLGVAAFHDAMVEQQFFVPDAERLLMFGLILLVVAPTGFKATVGRASAYPPVHPRLQAFVCDAVGDEGLLVTDIPWATAWYGQRPSLLLPGGYTAFPAATSNLVVSGVLMTAAPETSATGQRTVWEQLWAGDVPDGCGLTNGYWLPSGLRDQLLLLP